MVTDEAKIIRSELTALQDERIKLFQVGITLLAALEMTLYYVRRDIHDHLGLSATEPLPFGRFIVGTFMLAVIAGVFSMLTVAISKRNYGLRALYVERCPNDLPLNPRIGWALPIAGLCYFTVPLMDIVIRLWITVVVQVH